ncbi:hypothetical protein [Pseudooceanicola sp. LIPI14-2-Ac024]|uniref:hypothetical protein n=1 Tax=Pseudooceanicola sp. LIPI14-2-Ac024 TaxID=3344875 RepID=UPI0035CEB31C
MELLREVLSELFGMFVADARLTGAILGAVASTAMLESIPGLSSLAAGLFLLAATVTILVFSVRREARRRSVAARQASSSASQ